MTASRRTYIIAEIASAHEGDPALARELVAAAAAAGADAVKFQIFDRACLIAQCHPKYDAFGIIDLGPEAWIATIESCADVAVEVAVEVFDVPSLHLAEKTGAAALYKVPTSDIANRDLIERTVATGRPFFLAVGGATSDEIERAVEWVSGMPGGFSQASLMHGFQSYPTELFDTNLARISALRAKYGLPVGYADHVDADETEVARAVPLMAIASGATTLEKHITLNRSARGRDHFSALNPDEFADFVSLVRQLEGVMGAADPALNAAEISYRDAMKKFAVAAADLSEGHRLGLEDIAFKRTGRAGFGHDDLTNLVGRTINGKKRADDPLLQSDLAG